MKNSDIRREKKKKTPLWKKAFLFVAVLLCLALAGGGLGFLIAVSGGLPDVKSNITPEASSRIYDIKGKMVATVHAEENRIPVPISEVPDNLQNAFVAAEDIRFFDHHGIDPRGIFRAAWNNLTSGNATGQGGSTITQQLARNAFLTQEQTIKRKLLEAVLALEIESTYSKKEILEMYMNQIYFGQGCYGIQTAAHVYFGKDVKDLNLAQSALLAGLPNSPNYYSPFRSVEAAKARQSVVLDQMAKYGYITEAQAADAKAADLGLADPKKNGGNTGDFASYFVNYIIEKISEKYDSDAIYKEGLQVYTTLDSDMQHYAEEAMKRNLPDGYKDGNGIMQPQGALLSLEAGTGYVKAMVGGRGDDFFNRAVQMTRQPGSAFKPFVYVTAFDNGISPFDTLSNEPVTFGGWSPKNYGGTSGGKVTVADALIHSMNIPTVNLANEVGMGKVIANGMKMGLSTLVRDGDYSDVNLAAALGGLSQGVSVWDMAKAYSVFANEGVLIEPIVILKVVDRDGRILEEHNTPQEQKSVLNPSAVYKLTAVLEEVIGQGTGGNAAIGRPAAGKTGTTDDEHDAWFVGYTPELVTAVWMGDDTGSNAGYTGGTVPAAIWRDYMQRACYPYPVKAFRIPSSVRDEMAKAEAERKKAEEAEAKKKKEAEKKKVKDKIKEAGSKLLDRISDKL